MAEEDWQDRPYEGGVENVEGEEPFEGDDEIPAGDDEGPDLKAGYKDLQNVRLGRMGAGGDKRGKTEEEKALDRADMVVNGMSFIPPDEKGHLVDNLKRMHNIQLYNLDILMVALWWKEKKMKLSPKTFKEFVVSIKMTAPVDQVDLLRYIRFIEK